MKGTHDRGNSRLCGGSHGSIVGCGADELSLLVVFINTITSFSSTVTVLLRQLTLSLHLLLPQFSVVTSNTTEKNNLIMLKTLLDFYKKHFTCISVLNLSNNDWGEIYNK